jgi:hypothetical protein
LQVDGPWHRKGVGQVDNQACDNETDNRQQKRKIMNAQKKPSEFQTDLKLQFA